MTESKPRFECELSAAFVEITPSVETGSSIHCKGSNRVAFSSVDDVFEANAFLFKKQGRKFLLIQLDAFLIGVRLREALLAHFPNYLREDEFAIVASHTHFAPNLDDSLPSMGPMSEAYFKFVLARLVGLVEDVAAQKSAIVQIRLTQGPDSEQSVNRRGRRIGFRRTFPFWSYAVGMNPDIHGARDCQIRALEFVKADESSAALAYLWSYSCHPVCYPERFSATPEYPGYVRSYLRKMYGAEIPVIFIPGFMGDVRPRVLDNSLKSKLKSRKIGGPVFGGFSVNSWSEWASSIARDVHKTLRLDGNTFVRGDSFQSFSCSVASSEIRDGDSSVKPIRIIVFNLGDNFSTVFISAEPVAAYRNVFESLLPKNRFVLTCGYLDGVFGYLPTNEMLGEGGYEVNGFCSNYMLSGTFKPDVQGVVAKAFREILAKNCNPQKHSDFHCGR